MNDISLTMSVDEANLVLEGLGNLPFVKVHDLIRKIQQQAHQQMQEPDVSASNASQDHVANISDIDSRQQAALKPTSVDTP